MACYSPSFKDREEKKRETLKTWGNFNYRDLFYDLKNCAISGSIAHARVEWRILFSSKTGGPVQEGQTVLEVRFERREDGWKIVEVKPLG
jgi:ketosteroid isomerase-like protein